MAEVRTADVDSGPPAPVFLALIGSYALGAVLLLFGLFGFLTWAAVGNEVGIGATILGLIVLGASYVAWRGSRPGRALIALLAAVGVVGGVIYLFAGPTSAIFSSLLVAGLGAATIALLFLPEASKRFYSAA
jgi:hypothetical protein